MRRAATTLVIAGLAGCGAIETETDFSRMNYGAKIEDYVRVKLEADLSGLSERQRAMLPLLAEAAQVMDGLFWQQAFGDKDQFLSGIEDPAARRFAEINYGPWDRLGNNRPFLPGFGPKPDGANYYPSDMSKEEFEEAAKSEPELRSQYTLVRRDGTGDLIAVPYHQAFASELAEAAALLRQAAGMAEDEGFRRYLEMRASALEASDYQPSDFAWMDMRDNAIDLVIGPIESYEDKLFGSKTAFEAYVLIKDKEWSARLDKYSSMLPALQAGLPVRQPKPGRRGRSKRRQGHNLRPNTSPRCLAATPSSMPTLQAGLPVPPEYKSEMPGSDSQLNAYDVIYYAGDCNAGAKTIAINLPNDEQVQLKKGSRRLQLKNAMRAKFDNILLPIAEVLVGEDQRAKIDFDSFFGNTMFHEVAHGLGIKNTLDGSGTVRAALKEAGSALEEAKADILGLHLIGRLTDSGDLPESALESNYVTFLAGIFRSIRFGASSAHGTANTLSFNYFERADAFYRDGDTGTYRIDTTNMRSAVDGLSSEILRMQGNGDYEFATGFIGEFGKLGESLQSDLARIEQAGIPLDIVFEQGLDIKTD